MGGREEGRDEEAEKLLVVSLTVEGGDGRISDVTTRGIA